MIMQRVYPSLVVAMSLVACVGYAKPGVRDLLDYGPPANMSGPLTATATFQQVASGGTDASVVSKVTLRYFTSTDCTGAAAGTYSTPDISATFPINTSNTFNLNAASVYQVGNAIPLTMADIHSMVLFLKSTDSNTPQADFTGSCGTNPSFCCVPIDCSSGTECTAAIGTQNFELKTTAAIGDPADGGVIACTTGSGGAADLVAPAADNSTSIDWGGFGTAIGANAQSDSNGAANTATIVELLGTGTSYAARLCNEYTTTGGFTTGWFLPSYDQLNCLYTNRADIGGFADDTYWNSTENSEDPENLAWYQVFVNDDGRRLTSNKNNSIHVRCTRSFTP